MWVGTDKGIDYKLEGRPLKKRKGCWGSGGGQKSMWDTEKITEGIGNDWKGSRGEPEQKQRRINKNKLCLKMIEWNLLLCLLILKITMNSIKSRQAAPPLEGWDKLKKLSLMAAPGKFVPQRTW